MRKRNFGFTIMFFIIVSGALYLTASCSQNQDKGCTAGKKESWFWNVFRYQPKVFDCFIFFNELDLLDIRLNEMYNVVDKFIIVEATRTFQNKPKPLYFSDNKERYAKFADKIIHVVINEYPKFPPIGDQKNYHDVEIYQRNCIKDGLKRCRPHKRDIVMITDVDEIIRKDKIEEIKMLIDQEGNDVVFGEFDFFRYFLNRKLSETWRITIATSWGTFNDYVRNATAFRCLGWFSYSDVFSFFEKVKERHPNKKWVFARVPNVGWHFSSLGNHAMYLQKLNAWAHIRKEETNRGVNEIREGINQLEYCEITSTFPIYIYENQELFMGKGLIDGTESTFK